MIVAVATSSGLTPGRRAALAAAAAAINVGLIVLLSFVEAGISSAPAPVPPIWLEIGPRPLLPDERPRPISASAGTPVSRDVTALNRSSSSASPSTPAQSNAPPSSPAPRLAAPAPQGTPQPDSPWAVRPNGGAFARSLRQGPVGCASSQLLNDADRAACRQSFNDRAERAPPLDGTGNARRDSRFAREGARKLQEWEARRRSLSCGIGNVGVQEGVGSNFGIGVACAHLDPSLRPDSTRNVQTRRDGPPSKDRTQLGVSGEVDQVVDDLSRRSQAVEGRTIRAKVKTVEAGDQRRALLVGLQR